MAYRIEGLAREAFAPLFGLGEGELAARNARRVRAEGSGYPCRITLEEAEEGESLILVNHVSLDAPTPFRASHAIYVREAAGAPPVYRDEVPPVLDKRILGLRKAEAPQAEGGRWGAKDDQGKQPVRLRTRKRERAKTRRKTKDKGQSKGDVGIGRR